MKKQPAFHLIERRRKMQLPQVIIDVFTKYLLLLVFVVPVDLKVRYVNPFDQKFGLIGTALQPENSLVRM
jgi:hypothetical protein